MDCLKAHHSYKIFKRDDQGRLWRGVYAGV